MSSDLRFTVLQVVNEVQRKLGLTETATLTANKVATELVDHVNDTVDDLSDYGNWMETLTTAKVTAQVSVRDYVVQTSGVIKNIGDIYLSTRRGPLRSVDIDTMRIMTRTTALGQPSQYCIFGVDASSYQPIVRVRPTPDQSQNGALFSILYYKKPSQYTATGDANTVIPYPARVVINGVLARYTLRESGGAPNEMYQVYEQNYQDGKRKALNRFQMDTGWDVSFTPGHRSRVAQMSVMVTYRMPQNGLGTDFSEFDRPINFATAYENRFRNITGGAERRPGMAYFSSAAVPTLPNLTRLHEFVDQTGSETLLSSDDFGNIYRYNGSAWTTALTGKANARLISAEANNKLIFVNGVDRNFYTSDGGQTFSELKALITQGTLAAGSSAAVVIDGNISNWIGATLVSNNDIVYNLTRNGYGVVTTVASASLGITPIGTGSTGAGKTSSDQAPGDAYQLIDYVNLNVISDGFGATSNVATATTGTTTSVVAVSGINFANTEIRNGDFIYNTTRSGIAQVGTVSANVNLQQSISGQTSGDALVFFKSAMPISSWIHVHYGRVAYLDARNNQRVVFSAPDDPQDVTTFQKTLDSTSFQFGTQQPEADTLVSMETFLSYFVASGKKNLFIYQGDTPIQDTSSTTINFTPIAFYPNGVAGRFGLETNGGDLLHITVDGLQAINIGFNAFSVNQNNASVPILNELRNAINSTANSDNIQLTYYPRRRWLINKLGDQCYILNTQPSYDQTGAQQQIASWHLYTGLWAQQNHYFVRRNGDLLACGPNGGVYLMDASAATDVGTPIFTNLTTSWLRLEEPQITPRIKEFHFIRPVFESSPDVEYTISGIAGLDNYSSDSITVSAGNNGAIGQEIIGTTPIGGGSFAQTTKFPLRLRGEQARYQFTSQSSASEDILTSFSLYGNIAGAR